MRIQPFCVCALLLGSVELVFAAPIQFVVGELPGSVFHRDSFVVLIDDADSARIAHARALIDWIDQGALPDDSPGGTIVVAGLAAGADGVNRNVLAPGEPLWSWHTLGPIEFADFTIEILDGWPGFVEQNVAGWIANTNGAIGFWNYTIVAELGPIPGPGTGLLFLIATPWLAATVRSGSKRTSNHRMPQRN